MLTKVLEMTAFRYYLNFAQNRFVLAMSLSLRTGCKFNYPRVLAYNSGGPPVVRSMSVSFFFFHPVWHCNKIISFRYFRDVPTAEILILKNANGFLCLLDNI